MKERGLLNWKDSDSGAVEIVKTSVDYIKILSSLIQPYVECYCTTLETLTKMEN